MAKSNSKCFAASLDVLINEAATDETLNYILKVVRQKAPLTEVEKAAIDLTLNDNKNAPRL